MREEKPLCNAAAQILDEELSERSGEEIANAYRALCATMLIRTAMLLRTPTMRKLEIDQKQVAKRWLNGGVGLIPFESACSAVEVSPVHAKDRIGKAINMGGNKRSRIMRGTAHAAKHRPKHQTDSRMAPRGSLSPGYRDCCAGASARS